MVTRTAYLLTTNTTSERTLFSQDILQQIGFNVQIIQHTPHADAKVSNKLSMLGIYKTILNSDEEFAYVFEDDINMLEPITLDEIVNYEAISPRIFYLGCCVPYNNDTITATANTINNHTVFQVVGKIQGLHGIGLSKKGAEALLNFVQSNDDPNKCLDEIVGEFTAYNPAPILRYDLVSYIPSHRGIIFQDRNRFPSMIGE